MQTVAADGNHDAKRVALDLLLILILSAPSNHAGGLRAHRAWARCRVVGQERFAYFCLGRHSGFSKVSRRQGGTLSGRYRSSGYVLDITVSPVRPSSQASQLPHVESRGTVRSASAARGTPTSLMPCAQSTTPPPPLTTTPRSSD
ncbi:hypothetical protein DK871_09790 [Pseudomonas sp. L13]|nr:hypothetical protein [Pseudomonas sp. L13]